MMGRKSLAIAIILVLGLIPALGFAWTSDWLTCEQQDLEGTWNVKVWAGDSSGIQQWDQCALAIDSSGFIEAQGTYTDFMGTSADITGGQLNISADCVIEGTIETSNGFLNVERGGIVQDQLILDSQ